MSAHGRFPASPPVSLSPSSQSPSTPDLKQRVIACLNKLADRDTLALATAELDSIARNLTHDSFSSFLNCIHNTDSSCKSPVRKQCVAVLSLMSRYHGDSLSPHLSKMVSTVISRLRDPDSSVRSACAAATADMSAHVTSQPFASVAKPLIETLIQDGNSNAQIGAALCLAASVEAASDPESEQLRKSLPKIGKLLKSDGFKAKAALLSAVGSIISAGGAGTKPVLDWLVPVLVEFLSSEDWAARKSAAEALGKVATAEELASQYKKACTTALESRRFDKVKSVRETMNRTLNQWREVSNDIDEASLSPSRSSTYDGGSSIGCFTSVTRSSSIEVGYNQPSRPKKATPIMKRSPSLPVNRSNAAATRQKENLPKGNVTMFVAAAAASSVDNKGPQYVPVKQDSLEDRSCKVVEEGPDVIKHTISERSREDKANGFSRVVPCSDDGDSVVAKNGKDDVDESRKDSEELSLIREQLALIENQQSSLLDLLQKFMGSSQSGIQSLESRVSGLEMALDEISSDLAVSNGRVPKNASSCGGESCSKLPGPKFWRKTEERPQVQTRITNKTDDSEMAAQENSFDQGMRESTDANNNGQRGGSVFQKRSSRNQFQDSMHTRLQKPTTRLST
uniref:Microtubule-associated protein TORTIFOLIA1 n=1 Tax=Noccaea caerulescens TaxID=107243 RepID=A0A1J3FVB4_NOCCA